MVERICIKSINNAFQNWDNNPKDTAWLQKAEKYIKKLLDKKINQLQLYSILGSIYLKQEKFSKAKKEFENCIQVTNNLKLKEKYTLDVIVTIMHIVNQKINNRNKNFEEECFEAISLLQNLRELVGHYNYQTLQFVDFFYSKIIDNGITPDNKDKMLVDLCFLLDTPEISLNFDFQFKILNALKYIDFESCWVHIVKHSWDYRHNLKWNQFVRDYIDTFEKTFWNEIYSKSENEELLRIEIWAEYLFALDNIVRLYKENGEDATAELKVLKDTIYNKMPSSEDQFINDNSYAVKQEFMSRYARHKTIGVEHIMRECKESDNIWYEKIKESNVYWKISFNYQDGKLINELQELDDKAIKASYHEAVLDDIAKKVRYARLFNNKKNKPITIGSTDSINSSANTSIDQLNIPGIIPKHFSININDNEKISFQQSLGACERLSDSFYHIISYILCYDLSWLNQPIESNKEENQDFLEEDNALSSYSMNIPFIIDEQETRIFLFKDSHLDLIYTKLNQNDQNTNFEDFSFPLEHYFASDLYIIHDPWNLNKILNICMWHMYDGTFHRYLRFLFPNIPEYLNLSYLNNQNVVTLEDITCFLLILIIQRHIKCSHNKDFFKGNTFVGQTFLFSVIQHPIATVSSKVEKFWYSLIANYGRPKYKYMMNDIYSSEEIYKIILEIRGEYNTFDKSLIKDIWGLLGIHLMSIFMETELVDHSVEALHYMSLYLNEASTSSSSEKSRKQIDPSSILFEEIYDASDICGDDFYEFVLKKYKELKDKKCTRYESLVKNNISLLNAYIKDFDFLSDLEEGQRLMMTNSTSPISMEFPKLTIDEDEEASHAFSSLPVVANGEGEDYGNETLIKSSSSNSPIPSTNLEEVISHSGQSRLSRQLRLLQEMRQQQKEPSITKDEPVSSTNKNPDTTLTNNDVSSSSPTETPSKKSEFLITEQFKEEEEKEKENESPIITDPNAVISEALTSYKNMIQSSEPTTPSKSKRLSRQLELLNSYRN